MDKPSIRCRVHFGHGQKHEKPPRSNLPALLIRVAKSGNSPVMYFIWRVTIHDLNSVLLRFKSGVEHV